MTHVKENYQHLSKITLSIYIAQFKSTFCTNSKKEKHKQES